MARNRSRGLHWVREPHIGRNGYRYLLFGGLYLLAVAYKNQNGRWSTLLAYNWVFFKEYATLAEARKALEARFYDGK